MPFDGTKCPAETSSSYFLDSLRRLILGNWVSGMGDFRKLNIYYYSCLKSLHIGSLTSRVLGLRRTSCRYTGFSEIRRREAARGRARCAYTSFVSSTATKGAQR